MTRVTKNYEVSGRVLGPSGEPLRGARIVVWWQQIRGRKELAAGSVSTRGAYRLQFALPEGAPTPLLVIVEALSEYLDTPLFSPLTPATESLVIE
jgi:hypothetical protein